MLTNFHTHNELCRHARGNVFDYVNKAIKEKYAIIGISDHGPMPKYYSDRMNFVEFETYLNDIKTCKERYKDIIRVYSGLEVEFFPELIEYLKFLQMKTDYLILAPHDYFYKDKKYCAFFIDVDVALEGYFQMLFMGIDSGLYKFAAHPDLFAFSYKMTNLAEELTHKLGEICQKKKFILEFNANGVRRGKMNILGEYRYPYPYKPFWDIIRQYKVKVIVNSDCHDPDLLNDEFDKRAKELANDWNLNLTDTIF